MMRFLLKELICMKDSQKSKLGIKEFFSNHLDYIAEAFNDRDILTHYSKRIGKLMIESDEFN